MHDSASPMHCSLLAWPPSQAQIKQKRTRNCHHTEFSIVVLSALTGEVGSRLDVEGEVEYNEAVADYAGLHKSPAGSGQQPLQGWIWSGYSNGKVWPTPLCFDQADDGQHCRNKALTDVMDMTG